MVGLLDCTIFFAGWVPGVGLLTFTPTDSLTTATSKSKAIAARPVMRKLDSLRF